MKRDGKLKGNSGSANEKKNKNEKRIISNTKQTKNPHILHTAILQQISNQIKVNSKFRIVSDQKI